MSGEGPEVAVLLADIGGSTAVYEARGDRAAAEAVRRVVTDMRGRVEAGGGVFVSAKGDDVLCHFASAEAAVAVAVRLLRSGEAEGLAVHAGLVWGAVVALDGDIFGQSVNTAARLCALAKSGELLIDPGAHARLSPRRQAELVEVRPILLEGRSAPLRLYAHHLPEAGAATEIVSPEAPPPQAPLAANLRYGAQSWTLGPGQSLSLGRAREADLRVETPTVSRHHGTVRVTASLVEYADHSSTGSVVRLAGHPYVAVHRRQVVLTGEGTITLGALPDDTAAPAIRFAVRTSLA